MRSFVASQSFPVAPCGCMAGHHRSDELLAQLETSLPIAAILHLSPSAPTTVLAIMFWATPLFVRNTRWRKKRSTSISRPRLFRNTAFNRVARRGAVAVRSHRRHYARCDEVGERSSALFLAVRLRLKRLHSAGCSGSACEQPAGSPFQELLCIRG